MKSMRKNTKLTFRVLLLDLGPALTGLTAAPPGAFLPLGPAVTVAKTGATAAAPHGQLDGAAVRQTEAEAAAVQQTEVPGNFHCGAPHLSPLLFRLLVAAVAGLFSIPGGISGALV